MYNKKEKLFYLDYISAIAVIIIVCFHFNYHCEYTFKIGGFHAFFFKYANGTWAEIGVILFFIISGAKLMYNYGNAINIKKFYISRFKRVYPLFWCVYLIFTFWNLFLGLMPDLPKIRLLLSVAGMDGYFSYLVPNYYICGEWFLGAIIIFYILFPFMRKAMIKAPKTVGIVATVVYILVIAFNPFQVIVSRNLVVCIYYTLLGMYFIFYIKDVKWYLVLISAIGAGIFITVPIPIAMNSIVLNMILGGMMFFVLVYTSKFINGILKRLCEIMAKYSYAIFLVHHIIIIKILSYFYEKNFNVIEIAILLLGTFGVIFVIGWFLSYIIEILLKHIKKYNFSLNLILEFINKHMLLCTILIVSVLGMIIYSPYLFDGNLYITVYDAKNQFWPYFSYLGEYFKNEGWPMWSFNIGLGSVFSIAEYGDLFKIIPILLGRDIMPFTFAWLQLIKIILAALFMYLFLNKINLHKYACMIGSIGYSLCAIMIVRGNWYHYASELVYAAFLVWALERYFREKKKYLLIISLTLIFTMRGITYIYLYSILIFIYTVCRYIYNKSNEEKNFINYIIECLPIYFIALLISAIVWIPSIIQMLKSARFADLDETTKKISLIENLEIVLYAFLRSFKTELAGTINYYSGKYLNAPLFYTGIISLLLLPQTVKLACKRQKRLIILLLGFVGVYITIPTVRYVLNAFVAWEHIKLSSVWVVVVIVTLSMMGLQKSIIENNIDKKLMQISSLIFSLLLWGIFILDRKNTLGIRFNQLILVTFILILYTYIITCKHLTIKERMQFVLLFICIETTVFGYSTATHFLGSNEIVSGDEMKVELYKNTQVFDNIKEKDSSLFYRITANEYWNYCNPMLADYFDSSFYDPTVSSYYFFLKNIKPDSIKATTISGGIRNDVALESLIGNKYDIKKIGENSLYGYSHFSENQDYVVYRNENLLSIGFLYNKVIPSSFFDNLQPKQKSLALLSGIVIDDDKVTKKYNYCNEQLEEDFDKIDKYPIVLRDIDYTLNNLNMEYENGDISNTYSFRGVLGESQASVGIVLGKELEINDYTVNFSMYSSEDSLMEVVKSDGAGGYEVKTIDLDKGENKIKLQYTESRINFIMLRMEAGDNKEYTIKNFRIRYGDKTQQNEVYNLIYQKYVDERKQNQFELVKFSQNAFSGRVNADKEGMLFFSVPYHEGWSANIDGIESEIHEISYGFMGIEVGPGIHEIHFEFRTPGLILGIVGSVVGVLCFIMLIILEEIRLKRGIINTQ
ncbi:YfhO family protein [Kineothrix sp. MB12-C1]|uniref:YfhO family protein n=1 Tax=Kineothrix sp. MB12-C1 TaxID=3070215 RepID=UPI0027D1EE29|nr:YfhO family protein [Kineothrix sp. MB12-C1]WMC91708.1 YfhO family protein [Kineothrix sp. MB12-C1]